MTFEEALAQIDVAVREPGAALEELAACFRSGAISKEQEMASLRAAFEKTVQELTLRASNFTVPTMPTLRPKLRNVARRSFSMAMAFDSSSLRWVLAVRKLQRSRHT
jgi:6-phosphogluconate dehydrogenase